MEWTGHIVHLVRLTLLRTPGNLESWKDTGAARPRPLPTRVFGSVHAALGVLSGDSFSKAEACPSNILLLAACSPTV